MSEQSEILITGANGLLGRRLALAMQAENFKVHALVHHLPDQPVPGIEYYPIDFAKDWNTGNLPKGIKTVFHLAQSSKFREFPDQAIDVFQVNIASTAKLLDYAQKNGVERFVYASSGGVYNAGPDALDERAQLSAHGQLGYYLGSKLCGEILAENYSQHMIVNIVRLFFMYGPEQRRTMLIPRLIDNVRDGRPIVLQGEDGIIVNPLHVADAVTAMKKINQVKENSIFNIAGSELFSLREIANLAGSLTGKEPIFHCTEGRPKNLIADIEAMRKYLVSPEISLRDAMREMI